MLVTDIGDIFVGDRFGILVTVLVIHRHPLCFYIDVEYQHSSDVTKIKILSPTSLNCNQIEIIYITLAKMNRDSSHVDVGGR